MLPENTSSSRHAENERLQRMPLLEAKPGGALPAGSPHSARLPGHPEGFGFGLDVPSDRVITFQVSGEVVEQLKAEMKDKPLS